MKLICCLQAKGQDKIRGDKIRGDQVSQVKLHYHAIGGDKIRADQVRGDQIWQVDVHLISNSLTTAQQYSKSIAHYCTAVLEEYHSQAYSIARLVDTLAKSDK